MVDCSLKSVEHPGEMFLITAGGRAAYAEGSKQVQRAGGTKAGIEHQDPPSLSLLVHDKENNSQYIYQLINQSITHSIQL